MIINMIGGGGGAALNFKVSGGTTQPTNPTENTIWVNTSVNITSWAFSATAPASPKEGMVWISIGTSSAAEFNALKKNGIQVYPLSAKQFVGSSWVSRSAAAYQNSGWNQLETYVFKDGELRVITGFTGSKGTVSVGDTLKFTSNTGSSFAHWYSNEKIDVTNVTTIDVIFKEGGGSWSWVAGNTPSVGVSKEIPTSNGNGTISGLAAVEQFAPGSTNWVYIPEEKYSLDVSSVSGLVYLVFAVAGTNTSGGLLDIAEVQLI